MAEPAVAMNAYSSIQLGLVVDKRIISASALLGKGTKVESSSASANRPNAPNVTRYAETRVRNLVIRWMNDFNQYQFLQGLRLRLYLCAAARECKRPRR